MLSGNQGVLGPVTSRDSEVGAWLTLLTGSGQVACGARTTHAQTTRQDQDNLAARNRNFSFYQID